MRSAIGSLAITLLALGCAGSPEPPASAPARSAVTWRALTSGDVVGSVGAHGAHAWLGIPYAEPPVGALRWRAPRSVAWDGTREAVAFGPRCPQYASRLEAGGEPGAVIGDESCLTLNVWTPPDAAHQRLPVLFWIHGGGNVQGGTDFYDGAALAVRQNVVVVSANYRLGPFGWLRHAALREGVTAEEASGNFGTLDLIHALRWVRANAAVFGGDPERVTIFGESAGARNVLTLLAAPAARGLFHRAIAQSGGTRTSGLDEAERPSDEAAAARRGPSSSDLLVRLLTADGAESPAAARASLAGMSGPEIASYLRGKSPAAILAAYPEGGSGTGLYPLPHLFRDGVVLPEVELLEAFASGRYAKVPVILGTNRDEAKLFMFASGEHTRRWLGVFLRLRDPGAYHREARYRSRFWKANAVDELAAAMRRVQGATVFAYRFDWDEQPSVLGADLGEMLGAAHIVEVPFVFGSWKLGPSSDLLFDEDNAPGREALSDAMQSYWTEFAANGAPGRGRKGKLPEWKPWDASAWSAPKYIVLDTDAGGGIQMAHAVESTDALIAELRGDRAYDVASRCAVFDEWALSAPTVAARAGELGCGAAVASGAP